MVLALVAAFLGVALIVAGVLAHQRAQQSALDEVVGASTVPIPSGALGTDSPRLADHAVDWAAQVVERVDRDRSLANALDRARIPLRPGEFLIVTGAMGLVVAAVIVAGTGSESMAAVGFAAVAGGAVHVLKRRIAKRRRAFEGQLPDALSLAASSLAAGHTFLRAIQMMCEESDPPLSEEFARVVAETRLGDPVVDALERMADRLQVRDMDMVVQAIRIQQTVGGRLADLLNTLSDFIRARDEVRREVKVLTAEGRISAYVLAALVPFLLGMIQVMNPGYIEPMYRGWGLVVLTACGGSVVVGMLLILRMVRIDV